LGRTAPDQVEKQARELDLVMQSLRKAASPDITLSRNRSCRTALWYFEVAVVAFAGSQRYDLGMADVWRTK
jgi:hypothetical protein